MLTMQEATDKAREIAREHAEKGEGSKAAFWQDLAERGARLADPSRHCFREDGCAMDGAVGPNNTCCCCGESPEAHTGCDCEDERTG